MLGMAIHAYSDDGVQVPAGTPGDLICDQHFPCQPVGFWPLPGHGETADVQKARERYMKTYYEKVKGVWCKSVASLSFVVIGNLVDSLVRSWRSHSYNPVSRWKWWRHRDAWSKRRSAVSGLLTSSINADS